MSDPAAIRKAMEWGQALAAAQQKGDTAAVRKITEQLGGSKAPTKADSAEAAKHCVYPPQPPLVKEYLGLKRQLDSLGNLRQEAEAQAGKMEETTSGMNARQSAVFCERIKQFVQQNKLKPITYAAGVLAKNFTAPWRKIDTFNGKLYWFNTKVKRWGDCDPDSDANRFHSYSGVLCLC